MSEDRSRTGETAAARSEGRLPYEKPAVAWEQPLEARPSLMIGCGKQLGSGGPCEAVSDNAS